MMIKTRVFELCNGKYKNLVELATAMGISVSQVYRIREGKRSINQKFLIGAIKAFPGYTLGELFYLAPDSSIVGQAENEKPGTETKQHVLEKFTS